MVASPEPSAITWSQSHDSKPRFVQALPVVGADQQGSSHDRHHEPDEPIPKREAGAVLIGPVSHGLGPLTPTWVAGPCATSRPGRRTSRTRSRHCPRPQPGSGRGRRSSRTVRSRHGAAAEQGARPSQAIRRDRLVTAVDWRAEHRLSRQRPPLGQPGSRLGTRRRGWRIAPARTRAVRASQGPSRGTWP